MRYKQRVASGGNKDIEDLACLRTKMDRGRTKPRITIKGIPLKGKKKSNYKIHPVIVIST